MPRGIPNPNKHLLRCLYKQPRGNRYRRNSLPIEQAARPRARTPLTEAALADLWRAIRADQQESVSA